MRILHIEDEPLHHHHVKALLELIYGADLVLQWETEFDKAAEAILHGDWDVVLLDYVLGDFDASDVLREVDAVNIAVPFIIVSAFDEHSFDVEALNNGAEDYLLKGRFTESDIRRSIEYAIYRKSKLVNLNQMAFYDPLTGLPNRNYLADRLEKSVYLSTRLGRFVGVYYIDLNGFKAINDEFGHGAGDAVLRETGRRLRESMRRTDTAVRMGGDEFVVVSPGIAAPADATSLGAKLRDMLVEPVAWENEMLLLGCAIGQAVIPGDADTLNEAIEAADRAMYAEKKKR